MTQKMMEYRLANLSCASCAAKFEKNVRELPGVEQCQLNFGAAKLKVAGEVSIEQLEKAGAFDNIKVRHANETQIPVSPFYKQKENILAALAGICIVAGLAVKEPMNVWLFICAIVIGGMPVFITGIKNLWHVTFDMKTLMTIAIIGAAIIGEWQEAAIVVFLFAISEALETYSMNKARRSIEQLIDIAPKRAVVKKQHGDHVHEVQIETVDIAIGDILIVKPGQKIAMDGKVTTGRSYVNQASITGESIPVEKQVNDEVFAGTINEEGYLEIEVTKLVEDSTIAKIIHLVEEAQAEKAPSQQFVDRFAKYYTPAIMVVALLVAVVPSIFTGDWQQWIYQGLAVLVVGCPCALVISTPVAIVTAIGRAAKQGILIKGGLYLEQLAHIETVAFDKTGTLTNGAPSVTQMVPYEVAEEQLLLVAASVETSSQHPLAKAILLEATKRQLQPLKANDFQSVIGKGAYAEVNGQLVRIGNIEWLQTFVCIPESLTERAQMLRSEGQSVIAVSIDEQLAGLIGIADEVRQESKTVVSKLKQLSIDTAMLTGDDLRTAQSIAAKVGIQKVHANLLPDEKLTFIQQIDRPIAMIGDGVNDAPALANANVGISLGGVGSDVALETADIVMMNDDLMKLPWAIQLSKRTLKVIKQNIVFSLSLKLLALLLVIPGWLTLWIAIFADIGATLLVVFNSLTLLKIRIK